MDLKTINALALPISERGSLIKFVLGESRRGFNEIGFIPKPRLCFEAARGNLCVLRGCDEYLGFCLRGPWKKTTHIHQIWMRADARRRLYATLLLAEVLADAPQTIVQTIALNCADDLDAMLFWPSLGFEALYVRYPTNCRRRRVTRFERRLLADDRMDCLGLIGRLQKRADTRPDARWQGQTKQATR